MALTITYSGTKAAEFDGTLNSSFIPAYPHISTSDITGVTLTEAQYWERQQQCNELIAA